MVVPLFPALLVSNFFFFFSKKVDGKQIIVTSPVCKLSCDVIKTVFFLV